MKTLKLKSTMLQLHLYAYRTIWSAISGFWGKTERQTAFYLKFSGQSGVCGVSVYHANLFSLRDRQQGVFGRRIQSVTHDLGSSVVVTNIGRYQILGPIRWTPSAKVQKASDHHVLPRQQSHSENFFECTLSNILCYAPTMPQSRSADCITPLRGSHSEELGFFGPGRCLTIQASESPPWGTQKLDVGSPNSVWVYISPNKYRQLQSLRLTAWNLYCGYPAWYVNLAFL